MKLRFFLPVLLAGIHLTGAGPGQAAQVRIIPPAALPGHNAVEVQTGDAAFRVNQLEETVRRLNGQLEDLNFQLLQLQEQIRRMQEDNEYRFQELEGKRGALDGAGGEANVAGGEPLPGKSRPSEQDTGAQRSDGDPLARILEQESAGRAEDMPAAIAERPRRTIDGVEIFDPANPQPDEPGLAPGTLGSLTFDENGNVINSDVGRPIDLTGRERVPGGVIPQGGALPGDGGPLGNVPGNADVAPGEMASLSLPDNPDALYDLGYEYIQAGDYKLAEEAFGEFAIRYPENQRYSEARFWLGESLFSQGLYEEAARVFLETHRSHPQGRLGPQTLLKLGASLAGMNQRELACATYAELPRKYPAMPNSVRSRLGAEQEAASCKN